VPAPAGVITPHHLPGTNPFLHEVPDWYGIPFDAVRGGAETMRPEYRKVMGKADVVPQKCERYCDCGKDAGACNLH